MKNFLSKIIKGIKKQDNLTTVTLIMVLLIVVFYLYNKYFSRIQEGARTYSYGSWTNIDVGRSNSNTKTVTLPYYDMQVSNKPINKQERNWKDTFSVSVSGNKLTVKRVDAGVGWGQGLKLQARTKTLKRSGYRECKGKGLKKINMGAVKIGSSSSSGLPKPPAGKIWKLNSNKPAASMAYGYEFENPRISNNRLSIKRKNDGMEKYSDSLVLCVKAVDEPLTPGYACNKPDEKKISFRNVEQNSSKGTSLPRDRAGGRNWELASNKPANSIRDGYNLTPRVKPGSNVSIQRGGDRISGGVDVDVCIKDVSKPAPVKCSDAPRKAEEAKRKKVEKDLAKAIRERDAARLAAGNNAKDIEKYKSGAATADSERKRREADRLRREAEAKKREEERRAAAAEEKAALLRSERDKVATAEKLSQQQRERFNAERKRLMELQKRNEDASLSLREKMAKERQARLAAEESLFGAREQIDIVRNTEVNRCATSTERLEQRRKSQVAELQRNQELKEAARRRKLKEERDERLRLDALRREKAKEIAEERAKRLQILQMKLTREAHEKREQNRLRQVQINKKIMNNGEPDPSTSLQSGPAPVVGPNGTSVSITGKRMGPSSEMMNRISQYGVDQTNVGLKNSQEGGEETVIAGETTVGGFVYPGEPKMFGHLSNK